MPFVCEMFSADKKPTGKLIIDRDFLLFFFPFNEKDPQDEARARNHRDKLVDWVTPRCPEIATKFSTYNKFRPFDKRHDALEHCSSYDKGAYHTHYHYLGSGEIDSERVAEFFTSIENAYQQGHSGINRIMGPDNRKEIMGMVGRYFGDRTNEAKLAEADYKADKRNQALQAEKAILMAERKVRAAEAKAREEATSTKGGLYLSFAKAMQKPQGKAQLKSAVATPTRDAKTIPPKDDKASKTDGFFASFKNATKTAQGKARLQAAVAVQSTPTAETTPVATMTSSNANKAST